MAIFLLVAMAGYVFLYKECRRGKRELQAMHYWCNTGEIFHELRNDPFMTSEKWRAIVPLFEQADDLFAETHPYGKKFVRYSDLARREIDRLPFEEVGSP